MSSTSLVIWKTFTPHRKSQWPQKPLAPRVAWVHVLLVFPDIFKIDLQDFKRIQKVYSWWGMSSKKMALKSAGIFFPKQIISEWSHAVLHGVQLIWVIPNVGLQGWSRGTTVCEHLESASFQHYPTLSSIFDVSREIHRSMTYMKCSWWFQPIWKIC